MGSALKGTNLAEIHKIEVDIRAHKVPVSIVTCFDPRFRRGTLQVIGSKYGVDVTKCDQLSFAGGAHRLAENDLFALEEVAKSVALHNPEIIILTSHRNCGQVAASGRIFGNPENELAYHVSCIPRQAMENTRVYLEGQIRMGRSNLYVPDFTSDFIDCLG